MTYYDLVKYTKENHINWGTDLFDVLRGFFTQQPPQYLQPPTPSPAPETQITQEHNKDFKHPDTGEYSIQDVLDLFST